MPRHSKSYNFIRAPSEVSDQPAHPCSLASLCWSLKDALCSWLSREYTSNTLIRVLRRRGHTCNIMKTRLFKYTENFTTKKWKFSNKNSDIFHISAQNIDCEYSLEPAQWGGSNEYPQSTFLSRNKKNNVYPCTPQFYYIKVGFEEVNII